MTDEKQRALEGLFITDRETLKDAVREVLREEGILRLAKRHSEWDREYKGDAFWLEFRTHVVRLVTRNLAVAYKDLDVDPWFQREARIKWRMQWHRAVDQRLVPNEPSGSDGLELATFTLEARDRGTRFLTARPFMHCGIAKASKDPAVVWATRRKYRAAGPCILPESYRESGARCPLTGTGTGHGPSYDYDPGAGPVAGDAPQVVTGTGYGGRDRNEPQ